MVAINFCCPCCKTPIGSTRWNSTPLGWTKINVGDLLPDDVTAIGNAEIVWLGDDDGNGNGDKSSKPRRLKKEG